MCAAGPRKCKVRAGGRDQRRAAAQVLVVVFGQELPEVTATLTAQLFGLATALVGLATFALVLALLQQVVLEVIDSNVAQGSRVYESNHVPHPPLGFTSWKGWLRLRTMVPNQLPSLSMPTTKSTDRHGA